jgi:hypothetical protein
MRPRLEKAFDFPAANFAGGLAPRIGSRLAAAFTGRQLLIMKTKQFLDGAGTLFYICSAPRDRPSCPLSP